MMKCWCLTLSAAIACEDLLIQHAVDQEPVATDWVIADMLRDLLENRSSPDSIEPELLSGALSDVADVLDDEQEYAYTVETKYHLEILKTTVLTLCRHRTTPAEYIPQDGDVALAHGQWQLEDVDDLVLVRRIDAWVPDFQNPADDDKQLLAKLVVRAKSKFTEAEISTDKELVRSAAAAAAAFGNVKSSISSEPASSVRRFFRGVAGEGN